VVVKTGRRLMVPTALPQPPAGQFCVGGGMLLLLA
jgi:hypothetical protein